MACVIAAPSSSSGKTLLSLSLIAWAQQKGLSIQPFKVGPDYLDPQLLGASAGRPCRNLDLPLCGPDWVKTSFHGYGGRCDLALVEGVMGLFDGIGSTGEGSSAAVAKHLQLPVVLVVDAGGQARSLAALVSGFRDLDPDLHFAGVVLNRVSTERHRSLLEEVLAAINVPCLGCLPRDSSLDLPSRHLGLAPAHELDQLNVRLGQWAAIADQHLQMGVFERLMQAPTPGPEPIQTVLAKALAEDSKREPLPVAVAQDNAFHFRYPEMQDCLEAMGMPVIPWHPLEDEPLPQEAYGLVIPGGFPELHAKQLSRCQQSLSGLRDWLQHKPLYAECGGMLMLGTSLMDGEGETHAMAGVLPFHAQRGTLQVGYRRLTASCDSLLLKAGDQWMGHEFHRWQLSEEPVGRWQSLWQVDGWHVDRREEGWALPTVHASWVHLHWASSSTISCRWRDALETVANQIATDS
ncbi:cobyrinate a,c-diamide synthase [Synechococcus sp. WH 8016]|uniref:cobyrinate a,c-diamide synthase n=1 Tax=Synechococcus sp. WH 8016 TaxID=166318 RepID=UPI00022D9DDA|nr:cobyrinate a,c-diamide synthase [Synechococcus sp. WH 8016]EHA63113.1 cobyrinic acid a,c-diamide synthase [Synechococcus sp. WH 8016]